MCPHRLRPNRPHRRRPLRLRQPSRRRLRRRRQSSKPHPRAPPPAMRISRPCGRTVRRRRRRSGQGRRPQMSGTARRPRMPVMRTVGPPCRKPVALPHPVRPLSPCMTRARRLRRLRRRVRRPSRRSLTRLRLERLDVLRRAYHRARASLRHRRSRPISRRWMIQLRPGPGLMAGPIPGPIRQRSPAMACSRVPPNSERPLPAGPVMRPPGKLTWREQSILATAQPA